MSTIKQLQQRLNKIEAQLEKVRGCSPLTHGWQTQRYAKASRKWDVLARRKDEIIGELYAHPDYEDGLRLAEKETIIDP